MNNFCMITILFVAAGMDLWMKKIKNWLILSGIMIGMFFSILQRGPDGIILSFLGFLTPFPLLLFFKFKLIGAADIKLLSIIGIFQGPIFLIKSFLWMVVLAAPIALYLTIKQVKKSQLLSQIKLCILSKSIQKIPTFTKQKTIPLAVAILGGVVMTCLRS